MPRANKAIKRQRVEAAAAWKKGEHKEASALWDKATQARKVLQAKKKKNKQGIATVPEKPATE